jgi:outer membrane protein assembly factor BamD (BamD/ComL family)
MGCKSGPIVISDDLTTGELVQRAQEASDRNKYDVADQYYSAILERFPDDAAAVCGAKYEIAFIHYKQKKYNDASEEFNEIIDRYDEDDGALLPQKYLILSRKVLDEIQNKIPSKPEKLIEAEG